MFVVFDTETSGLFNFGLRADAEGQPRLASAAFVFLDSALNIEKEHSIYVKPVGWQMSAGATEKNGITDEFLHQRGVPVANVLNAYNYLLDQGHVLVGHNVDFDLKVMRGELRRADLPDRFHQTRSFCTMKAATPLCQLPGKRGYKWPKLMEAYEYFFNEHFDNAHEALADARATARIFRHLHTKGFYEEAA